MKRSTKYLAFAVSALSGLALGTASAQNPNFAPGDLVLFFQNPGGTTGSTQTIMLNLGSAATFRDATSSMINITNIGSTLTSTYGASWWDAGTLYLGLSGVRSNSALNPGVVSGDPTRTLYTSRARLTVGTAGSAGSDTWTILGDGDMTTGASGMIQLQNVLETQFSGPLAVSSTTQSQVDDQNPFIQAGIQGAAFNGIFPGGVQGNFGPGIFGNLDGVDAEAALDLYRILARNDLGGQVGGPVREGTFEGTIVVDQSGNVSFLTVPEPSSAGLAALGTLLVGFHRRRKRQTA